MMAERTVRRFAIAVVLLVLACTGSGLALLAVPGRLELRVGTSSALALAIGLTGALILWHRPTNRIGALMAATGALFGVTVLAGGVLGYASARSGVPGGLRQPALAWAWLTQALSLAWVLFLLWFPDGNFLSVRWKRFVLIGTVASLAVAVVGYLLSSPGGRLPGLFPVARAPASTGGPLATSTSLVYLSDVLSLALPLVALAALAQRFQHSGAVVRQQIKWFVAAAAAAVIGSVISAATQDSAGAAHAVGAALGIVVSPLPEVAAALAIFRYRLWEIEVVISRALMYAVLWAMLSVVLLVPALATGLLVGGPSALAAVGLALLVTVAFQPARARLERVVERIVYRHRPRGYALLTHLGETLRAAIGVEELAPHLANVVRSGLGASWAAVWLHVAADGGGALRPVAAAGIEPGPSVLIAAGTSVRLRSSPAGALTRDVPTELEPLWPGTTVAALVPLVS